jgi:hypothetical protein
MQQYECNNHDTYRAHVNIEQNKLLESTFLEKIYLQI